MILIICTHTGTIWYLARVIEGAGAGVKALQDKGKQFVYSSNNAVRTEEKYVAKFAESEIKATFVSEYSKKKNI